MPENVFDESAKSARMHLRRKAVEFDEADGDGDQEIDYEEFCKFVLPRAASGAEHSEEELKEWWGLMDVDGDGFIRKDEFFLYALCAASRRSGSGIESIFRTFDKDASGTLDEIEFENALEEMGFADAATAVFDEHANHSEHVISYLTLLKRVEERTNQPSMRAFLLALASDSMLKVDTSSWSFTGETAQQVRDGLCGLLKQHKVRLSDLFQKLDDDGSFSLSLDELKEAFWQLGYSGSPDVIRDIFKLLDQDGSGKAGFDEFSAWVNGRKIISGPRPKDRASRLSLRDRLQESFDADDDAWSTERLRTELATALAAEGLRAIDLLKAWDKNGTDEDGVVTKKGTSDHSISHKEYLVGLKKVCGGAGDLWYAMARSAAVDAFTKMDRSGDKSISVSELCRWIDPHGRLVAAGRTKSKSGVGSRSNSRAALEPLANGQSNSADRQPTGGEEVGELVGEPAGEQGIPCCYSPTKFSTRLAQVRAYDPDTAHTRSKKGTRPTAVRRVPLWKPRNPLVPISPIKPSVCGRDISHLKWREPGTHAGTCSAKPNGTPRPNLTGSVTAARAELFSTLRAGLANPAPSSTPSATPRATVAMAAAAAAEAAEAVASASSTLSYLVAAEEAREEWAAALAARPKTSGGALTWPSSSEQSGPKTSGEPPKTAPAPPKATAEAAALSLRLSIMHATDGARLAYGRNGLSIELMAIESPMRPSGNSCPTIPSPRATLTAARPTSAPLHRNSRPSPRVPGMTPALRAGLASSRAAGGTVVQAPPSLLRVAHKDRAVAGGRVSPRLVTK